MKFLPALLFSLFAITVSAFAAFPVNSNIYTSELTQIDGQFMSFPPWSWAGYDSQTCTIYVEQGDAAVSLTGYSVVVKVIFRGADSNTTYISKLPADVTVSGNTFTFTVPYTNVPPNKLYHAEAWAFEGATTNQTRTLAQWQIRVHDSLYDDDDGTYPWPSGVTNLADYLLVTTAASTYVPLTAGAYTNAITNLVAAGSGLTITGTGRSRTIIGMGTNSASLAPGPSADLVLATDGTSNYWTTASAGDITAVTVSGGLLSGGAASGAADVALTTSTVVNATDPTFATEAELTSEVAATSALDRAYADAVGVAVTGGLHAVAHSGDHGALSGRDDDDHTNYTTHAEAVDVSGDTMTGDLGMGGNSVTDVLQVVYRGGVTATNYIEVFGAGDSDYNGAWTNSGSSWSTTPGTNYWLNANGYYWWPFYDGGLGQWAWVMTADDVGTNIPDSASASYYGSPFGGSLIYRYPRTPDTYGVGTAASPAPTNWTYNYAYAYVTQDYARVLNTLTNLSGNASGLTDIPAGQLTGNAPKAAVTNAASQMAGNNLTWNSGTGQFDASAAVSFSGAEAAVDVADWWPAQLSDCPTTTNAVPVRWSAEARPQVASFSAAADGEYRSLRWYAVWRPPSTGSGLAASGIVVRVVMSNASTLTNYCNLTISNETGDASWSTNSLVSSTANTWRKYHVPRASLPGWMTNLTDDVRVPMWVDDYTRNSNYVGRPVVEAWYE